MAYTPVLPQEIWDLILSLMHCDKWTEFQYFSRYAKTFSESFPSQPKLYFRKLCELRLVSRTIWKSATFILLKKYTFVLDVKHQSLAPALKLLLQPAPEGTLGDLVGDIRSLSLDFRAVRPIWKSYYPDPSPPMEELFEPNFLRQEPFILDDPCVARCEKLIKVLPTALQRLHKLSCLEVKFPVWKNDHRDGWVTKMKLDRITALMNAVLLYFQTQPSTLLTLRLRLLCTHDFGQVAKLLPDTTTSSLREITLLVTDSTGMDGHSKNYYEAGTVAAEADEEDFLPSELQMLHPNKKHASSLFDILARCPNLTSLELAGTHFLDAWNHPWDPSYLHLEYLHLKRVRITETKLLKLMFPQSASQSKLKYLWLSEVELTSGTWSHVLNEIVRSKLPYFKVGGLQYYLFGQSRWYRVSNYNQSGEYCERVNWTKNEDDEVALAALNESSTNVSRIHKPW